MEEDEASSFHCYPLHCWPYHPTPKLIVPVSLYDTWSKLGVSIHPEDQSLRFCIQISPT